MDGAYNQSQSRLTADILLYYAQKLKNTEKKNEISKNTDLKDPVTVADLEVNNLILKKSEK